MLELLALLVVIPSPQKCSNPPAQMPGYEWRQPVMLVDGVIVPSDPEQIQLRQEDIASIRIACWDPATNSFAHDGIPVIILHTKTLLKTTRAPLLRFIRAQEEFRSRHQRYATDLESLAASGVDSKFDLTLEASASHWKATTPSGDVAYQCSANEMSAGAAGDDGEPRLECAPVDTLALRSLRERYDAGW